MKLYAITESYQWYKGADATHWGVYKTIEEAKAALIEIIKDKYEYLKDMFLDDGVEEEEVEAEIDKWINDRFLNHDHTEWLDEDDDSVTKFYIDETSLDD